MTIEYRVLKGFKKYSKRIEFDLVILVGKAFQRRGPMNFRERKPYWVVLTEAT